MNVSKQMVLSRSALQNDFSARKKIIRLELLYHYVLWYTVGRSLIRDFRQV